ncbi:MAG TPA: hypothetical protein VFL59_05200 [Candidatus Nanopelagicales bacterium]|nr:hypothetical protein [Candidatus Nanopelagicales bacterium]
MRRLLLIGFGAGIGYVLGARAGRPAYERIEAGWHRMLERTGLEQTAQTMTSAAQDLGDAGMQSASDSLGSLADKAASAMSTASGRLREDPVDVSDSTVWTKTGSAVEE